MEDLEIHNMAFCSEPMLIDQVTDAKIWFHYTAERFKSSKRFVTIESDAQNTYHIFSFYIKLMRNTT